MVIYLGNNGTVTYKTIIQQTNNIIHKRNKPILGLSYNHPRLRWELNPCLSKRAPQAEVLCMGNQPVAQRETQAEDRRIGERDDFLYTSVRILRAAVPPIKLNPC